MSKTLRTVCWIGVLGIAGIATSACNAEPPVVRVSQSAEPIAGGQLDTIHSSVFLFVAHQPATDGGQESASLCTATLIAPNLLLTARHCVAPDAIKAVTCGQSPLGTPIAAENFLVTNSPMATSAPASAFYGADKVSVPSEGNDTCGFDVALVRLSRPVSSGVTVPAIPRIDRPVQQGEVYTAVGYGEDQFGNDQAVRMDLGGLVVSCAPGTCGIGVESTEFLGDRGICSGDSGGPALDADGKVVGVVSRGGAMCTTPIYSTVTAWRDFIIQNAAEAATAGGYAPPFWVLSGTSDPSPEDGGAGSTGSADAGASGSTSSGGSGSGTQGAVCHAAHDCAAGYRCYSPSGSSLNAYCAASCGAGEVCQNGTTCAADVEVCVQGVPSTAIHSSCSLALLPGPSQLGATLLAGLAALALLVRRRRAPANSPG